MDNKQILPPCPNENCLADPSKDDEQPIFEWVGERVFISCGCGCTTNLVLGPSPKAAMLTAEYLWGKGEVFIN